MEVMDSDSLMKPRRCYCGPQGITIGDILGRAVSSWQWLGVNKTYRTYTHKGRCGLGLLCRYWNLKTGDEILMPAYNCGSEIDPFLAYDLSVVFYKVDLHAKIDFKDILQRVTSRTKVIYVTHYFGWPQDIKELCKFCNANHIYLIEDCTLSLFSNPVDYPIGFSGDAAIYNFPKTLPVPDGGTLTLDRGVPVAQPPKGSPGRGVIFREMLPFIKRAGFRLSEQIGLYRFIPQRLTQSSSHCGKNESITPAGLPEMPKSYYYDKNIENLTASVITRYILGHICPELIVKQRRKNYSGLYEALIAVENFRPLYHELPDGVCPLYLPVMVEDRDTLSAFLSEKGITTIKWWAGFHRAFDWKEFPDSKYLKEHILAVPVHQNLYQKNIDYISSSLRTLLPGLHH